MLTDEQASSWQKANELNSTEWKKEAAHGQASF